MSDVEFDADKLKNKKLPIDFSWVLKHAEKNQTQPKLLRRASMASYHRTKTDLSLKKFIADLLDQYDSEQAIDRWMAVPSEMTRNLFRHWAYISEDALKLEIVAAKNAHPKGSRRVTQ